MPKRLATVTALAAVSTTAVFATGIRTWNPPGQPMPAVGSTTLGEIAMSRAPLCEAFVVRTERGFVLVRSAPGSQPLLVEDGQKVAGTLHARGERVLDLAGLGRTRARIDDWGVGSERAARYFNDWCWSD